jgi:tRNA(Ile)-lysidine synthase
VRFASKVEETIQKYRMLSPCDRVLVAVSGGPDSVALLHVLWKMKDEFNLRLEVAHLQHGIRGEEAREDARFVAELADRWAIPVHLKELELPKIKADRGKGNLEEMAREARRHYFAALAGARDIQKVALGHTRDDQAETFLMRLLRGSGRKGLAGMAPVSSLSEIEGSPALIRPLIETSRQEIENYLADEKLNYRLDRTNLDPALLRNWIRLDLLPRLRERIDRRLGERLAQLADGMRDEEKFLRDLTRELLPQITREGHLLRGPLLKQPVAMRRRLIRLWLEKAFGNLRGVEFDHVEAILGLTSDGPPQGRVAIPKGLEVVRSYDTLRLEKKGRVRCAACYSYTLPQGGDLIVLEAGVKIASARSSSISRPDNELEAVFDSRPLPEVLTVRNFRNGDRFVPLGMTGRKKVKDHFIDKKVPLNVRATLPLVAAGEEILWIPGYARSEIAKLGPATREVLKIKLTTLAEQKRAGEFHRKPPAKR